MNLSAKNFIFLISLLISSVIFSQGLRKEVKKSLPVPNSIYSIKSTSFSFNSKFNLNNRLDLMHYRFVYLNKYNIENNDFTFPISPFGRKPSSLIFDTYNDINHSMNLKSSFFKVSELYHTNYRGKK